MLASSFAARDHNSACRRPVHPQIVSPPDQLRSIFRLILRKLGYLPIPMGCLRIRIRPVNIGQLAHCLAKAGVRLSCRFPMAPQARKRQRTAALQNASRRSPPELSEFAESSLSPAFGPNSADPARGDPASVRRGHGGVSRRFRRYPTHYPENREGPKMPGSEGGFSVAAARRWSYHLERRASHEI